MFFCPTCKGLVDPEHTNGGIYACAKCGGQGPLESLSENKMINGSLDFYAKLFHRHWLQCGMDADLYLKKFKSEGRHAKDVLKDDFAEGVKILKEHRQNRELVIYPLVNMLKDDIGGSDMLKRIETFLRA